MGNEGCFLSPWMTQPFDPPPQELAGALLRQQEGVSYEGRVDEKQVFGHPSIRSTVAFAIHIQTEDARAIFASAARFSLLTGCPVGEYRGK